MTLSDPECDLFSQCSDTSYMSELDDMPQSISIDFSNGCPINGEDFLIVHFNINCITAEDRLEELTNVYNIMKIYCLVLTKTKIYDTIPYNLFHIQGYHEPTLKTHE